MSLTVKQALQAGLACSLERIDVEALLCALLDKDRGFLFAWPEHALSTAQVERFQHWLALRCAGQPVAYITGVREFWSLPLQTEPSTLIPRPDTEVLVETVLAAFGHEPRRCVDLGTGTGAIALALKSERCEWDIMAVDRIPEAVALAQHNANHLGLRVHCQQGNWLMGFAAASVDVIVANPPYIDAEDEHLQQGDVRFEPRSALVAADQGLADIKMIIAQSVGVLRPGGAVFLEHGLQQGTAVRGLLAEAGLRQVTTVNDYSHHERVSYGFQTDR